MLQRFSRAPPSCLGVTSVGKSWHYYGAKVAIGNKDWRTTYLCYLHLLANSVLSGEIHWGLEVYLKNMELGLNS